MSEHTKEPWRTEYRVRPVGMYAQEIFDESGQTIATMAWYPIPDGRITTTNREANARRIVACVNACQRLDTDLLERITKNGGFGIHPRPQERIEELEQQCNDYKARALSYEAANMEQGKLLNEVIAEREELRKDAERYRWLQENRDVMLLTSFFGNGCVNRTVEEVDAYIDDVLAKMRQ